MSNEDILSCSSVTANYDGSLSIELMSTEMRTGKTTVTVRALDGSNVKATCTVDVINPVSEVRISPATAGANACVTAGKTLNLKAVLGTEYGTISNKNVTWELLPTAHATISATGVLKASASAPNKTVVYVVATAKDGSKAYASRSITIYQNVGKMTVTNISGTPVKTNGETWENDSESQKFYVKVKGNLGGISTFGGFRLSSSSPQIGSVRYEGVYYSSSDPGYYIYEFKCLGIKKGNCTLKVMTYDGSQSVTYNLKVKK